MLKKKASRAWVFELSMEPPTFIVKTGLGGNSSVRLVER